MKPMETASSPLKSTRIQNLLFFLLILALVLLRTLPVLTANEPWAEDGTDFLPGALWTNDSVFKTVAACMMVTERLIARFAVSLSHVQAPAISGLICTVLFTATCCGLLHHRFSWILPSRPARMVLCLLIAFTPASLEVSGGLNCLTYVIAAGLMLTLLTSPSGHRQSREQIIIAGAWVIGLASSTPALALFPLTLARWYLHGIRYAAPALISVIFLLLQAVLSNTTEYRIATPGILNPADTLTRLTDGLVALSVYGVLPGRLLLNDLTLVGALCYRIAGLALFFLIVNTALFRLREHRRIYAAALICSVCMFCTLQALGRGFYAQDIPMHVIMIPPRRHFWMGLVLMLPALMLITSSLRPIWKKTALPLIAGMTLTGIIAARGWNKDLPSSPQWAPAVEALEQGAPHASYAVAPFHADDSAWAVVHVERVAESRYRVTIEGGNP